MVTFCQTCGDQGFEEALIYCDSCEVYAVHRYCLERMPTNFRVYISWFCSDCDGSESGSENVEIEQTRKLGLSLNKNEKRKESALDEKNTKSRRGSSESSNRLEDNTLEKGTNVELAEVCSSSNHEAAHDSGRRGGLGSKICQGLYLLERNEASVSAASTASSVAEHDSSANKRRKLTPRSCDEELDSPKVGAPLGALTDQSDSLQLPYDNRQLAVVKSSCEEAESQRRLSEWWRGMGFYTQGPNGYVRAHPKIEPVWRGFLSANVDSFGSIILVAHLSSIACTKVCEAASSLPSCLSAEIFPRLEIWPRSFLRNGGPNDESIGLFFFPCGSDEKVLDDLIGHMREKDVAMRVVLDNAELLLFTSYELPVQFWRFQSKFYLWGAFRGKQASRLYLPWLLEQEKGNTGKH